jgi:hypothetical protein
LRSLKSSTGSGISAAAFEILTKWYSLTRLETRTKESNIYASIWAWKPLCAMKVNVAYASEVGTGVLGRRGTIDRSSTCTRFEYEHICWDPKDGDLCLNRAKPGETLVEARSDTDVQIVRLIWV